MNELYEKTIEVDGKTYRYDPDHDCYYRSHPQTPESFKEKVFNIGIAIGLLILLILVTPTLLEWVK